MDQRYIVMVKKPAQGSISPQIWTPTDGPMDRMTSAKAVARSWNMGRFARRVSCDNLRETGPLGTVLAFPQARTA